MAGTKILSKYIIVRWIPNQLFILDEDTLGVGLRDELWIDGLDYSEEDASQDLEIHAIYLEGE